MLVTRMDRRRIRTVCTKIPTYISNIVIHKVWMVYLKAVVDDTDSDPSSQDAIPSGGEIGVGTWRSTTLSCVEKMPLMNKKRVIWSIVLLVLDVDQWIVVINFSIAFECIDDAVPIERGIELPDGGVGGGSRFR